MFRNFWNSAILCICFQQLCCTLATSHAPMASPFFFLCQYHHDLDQPGVVQGEIALSVNVNGNPEFYEPEKIYEVTVSSSLDFDGFLMTGIYTTPSGSIARRMNLLSNNLQPGAGKGLMCAVVHSHLSHRPSKSLSFLWMAPSKGTGCVNFLATATLGHEVMFKDMLALQLCEAGDENKMGQLLDTSIAHGNGVVLREDFEHNDVINPLVWSEMISGEISDQCGNVLHGKAATFCNPTGPRSLITIPLNMTTASNLQFALGIGNCSMAVDEPPIDVFYGTEKCTKWHELEQIRLQPAVETTVHILCLPPAAKSSEVCIQWYQESNDGGGPFKGCWALDNIIVSNVAERARLLEETFDPIDLGNWYFFPGGTVKRKCHSEGNALVFQGAKHHHRSVTTTDINLLFGITAKDIIFNELFEGPISSSWVLKGGEITKKCEISNYKSSLMLSGKGSRKFCSPFLNSTNAGNLRFHFLFGGENCSRLQQNSDMGHNAPVHVYAETSTGEQIMIEDVIHAAIMEPTLVSLSIPAEAQTPHTRFCWSQAANRGLNKDIWVVDNIILLPWVPLEVMNVLQFRANLHCGGSSENNEIRVEFSTTSGHSWHPLHHLCLPPSCTGSTSALHSRLSSLQYNGWNLIAYPLPYAALVDGVRFRFIQVGKYQASHWAIDDVYFGLCPDACNGHGKCTSTGCECYMGYSGLRCETSAVANPSYLSDMFQSPNLKESETMAKILGADVGYQCGTLGSGKAVVFDKEGPRQLITREVNSTHMRFLQFTARLGSSSHNSPCLAPNHPSEVVFVHYSCNGGLTWKLLEVLVPKKFSVPKIVSLTLLPDARHSSCQFKIWQPYHSGKAEDVWALDDISLSSALLNVISLNFSDLNGMNASVRYSSGIVKPFCHSQSECVSFDELVSGVTRSLETKSLTVGPSYMVQFDLIMGCGSVFSSDKDNRVRLEFSTNHGMSWQPVYKPCLPANGSCNGVFTKGTVYDWSEFGKWKRVTVSLLPATWSSSTRFRFIQKEYEASDTWALDNLYIGPQCPDMCSGHGRCVESTCHCDDGFFGKSCVPKEKLKNTIIKRFETQDEIDKENFDVSGGTIVSSEEGCGLISSGAAVYFYQDGIRQLVTNDLDTEQMGFIQFFIRIGGGDPSTCNNASQKNEGILVQFSNDAGISWGLLRKLDPQNYRMSRLEHVALPVSARTYSTRLRWWQPQHSGEGKDQWAMDDLYLDVGSRKDPPEQMQEISAPEEKKLLSATTKFTMQPYCNSSGNVLLLNGPERWKFLVTRPINLREGHVIMFKISVGCTSKFNWDSQVRFEYSHDAGVTWSLVQLQCYPDSECEGPAHEASVYHSGFYGHWKRVLVPVTHHLAQKQTLLRWFQGRIEHDSVNQLLPFAITDLYIGYPCPMNCLGHGHCSSNGCSCDPGYQGSICSPIHHNPSGMVDRFDEMVEVSNGWEIYGGKLGVGCGNLSLGNSLYFSAAGYRIADTSDLDTTHLKTLQFVAQLGSVQNVASCRRPKDRSENIFVQYSTSHGLTWTTLRELHFEIFSFKPSAVELILPNEAKTISTRFRWWQPIGKKGHNKAQWAIDNVQVLGNHRNSKGFEDKFDPMSIENWFLIQHGTPKPGCSAAGKALMFAADHSEEHYAETWDFDISPATFLQYDIMMGCGFNTNPFHIDLEFSVDKGRSWALLYPSCLPPDVGCHSYSSGSVHISTQYGNWTRITEYLPVQAISPSTRFRWIENVKSTGQSWAIDNIYLGEGCTWMCSGHGHCVENKCVCDPGFGGLHCVPQDPLSCELRDTFDVTAFNQSLWAEIYGGEISTRCGILVSGSALTFYKDEPRMAVSHDLDLTSAQFIQFTLKYGCRSSVPATVTRANGILIQYSKNGGITWNLLKELHFAAETFPKYYLIQIKDPGVQTNATRLRIWQPQHDGFGIMEWAIDNFYVGGMSLQPNVLYDPMDIMPQPDAWLFWPGGSMGDFCGGTTSRDALVFSASEGERTLYTRDMSVTENYAISFEMKVGCGTTISPEDPVSLEYSTNQGLTWHLVKASWTVNRQGPDSILVSETPSIYYSNNHLRWQRIIVPLQGLKICGKVRFRWTQGFHSLRDSPSAWSIDNVYIGPSCSSHCMSRGTCMNGIACFCDPGYEGNFCHTSIPNPSLLKDGFEGNQVDSKNWEISSGSEISLSCGILISGTSLVFSYQGERILCSRDLDLTLVGAIQFYLQLGCSAQQPSTEEYPVLLQYSVDGGSVWNLLEEFSFGENPRGPRPTYIAIELPHYARTNATRIRWWQPSFNGTFYEEWAIDQVFIGGDLNGVATLNDDFSSTKEANWVLNPGAQLEPVCGSRNNFLHFRGTDEKRYAVTTDVVVGDNTYIQFELAMGCSNTGSSCYSVILEFSIDMGKTWSLVRSDCLPTQIDCNDYYEGSIYYSDMNQQINRIVLPLPYYTRTQTTRFRWIQEPGFKSSQTWAIGHLYIGEECDTMCSGHGKCASSQCKCDDGWTGYQCEEPKSLLDTELRDDFDSPTPSNKYHLLVGGIISELCGPVASGPALHFYGSCSRQIVTKDMDLQNATVIQFYFRYGCISPPESGNHTVFLQYSLNGGITWKTLKELYFKNYLTTSYVAIHLPDAVRQKVTRIRWWQPRHAGRAHSDWALDQIFIGGLHNANDHFVAFQQSHSIEFTNWLSKTHVMPEPQHCNSEHVAAVGKSTTTESSVLETTDVHVKKDYVLEFMFTIGCNESWLDPGMPVQLEYSVDFGQSWNLVAALCLPSQLSCGRVAQYPSVFYSPLPWQRFTIPLTGDVVSKWTRFRWIQNATQELSPSHKWGLKNVYIGPQCPEHCSGHGTCLHSVCHCGKGYNGLKCNHPTTANPSLLKDTFDESVVDSLFWRYVVGGKVGAPCTTLVEYTAVIFYGQGPRIVETVDLDLRDAKFVHFVAQLGGKGDNLACIVATHRNQSVFLQFSVNGGITWELLHELDYSLYSQPHTDHILLPDMARTGATRLRWWQASGLIKSEDLWPAFTLDNVFIGGNEINAFQLFEDFEPSISPNPTNWWFHPYGKMSQAFCNSASGQLLLFQKEADIEERGIVTRELIVEDAFMIQFKIAVGCPGLSDHCITNHSIRLEYTKDPGGGEWELVRKGCFPSNVINPDCSPNDYHLPSVYSSNSHGTWSQITMYLPDKTYSSITQFRWIQETPIHIPKPRNFPSWAIDDVYIGEACPSLCRGNGMCINGNCHCHPGYSGKDCQPTRNGLGMGTFPTTFMDSFEAGYSADLWEVVKGGRIGQDCGSLAPHGGGNHLYMGQCGIREAITKKIDTSSSSKLMFVLRIGSEEGYSQCHVNLHHPSSVDKAVLLQYSDDNGASWRLLALHSASDFKQPRRIVYEIPDAAKMYGVRFKWWQPFHEGPGNDQWALDNVEIVGGPYEQRRFPGTYPNRRQA